MIYSFSFKYNPALRKIHSELMIKLMTGIITNKDGSASFTIWKEAFEARISDLPAQRECTVRENFNFMKSRGLLGVGKYQVLKEVLEGNYEALSAIDETLNEMAKVLKDSGYDTSILGEYFIDNFSVGLLVNVPSVA